MTVTRDVVRDLVTLDLAGEASADSRALIADYLAADPDLAAQVEAARGLKLRLPPPRAAQPEAERVALSTTQGLLRQRSWSFGLALFLSLMPLSVAGDDGGLRYFLIRDSPALGLGLWAVAALFWAWYLQVRHRVRVSGL